MMHLYPPIFCCTLWWNFSILLNESDHMFVTDIKQPTADTNHTLMYTSSGCTWLLLCFLYTACTLLVHCLYTGTVSTLCSLGQHFSSRACFSPPPQPLREPDLCILPCPTHCIYSELWLQRPPPPTSLSLLSAHYILLHVTRHWRHYAVLY